MTAPSCRGIHTGNTPALVARVELRIAATPPELLARRCLTCPTPPGDPLIGFATGIAYALTMAQRLAERVAAAVIRERGDAPMLPRSGRELPVS